MTEKSDAPIPRLDPMSSSETRAQFVLRLKAQIESGEYEVLADDIAGAVIIDLAQIRRSE